MTELDAPVRELTPEEIAARILADPSDGAQLERDLRMVIERAEKRGGLLAGHRTDATHDCFAMNCRGLGHELAGVLTPVAPEVPPRRDAYLDVRTTIGFLRSCVRSGERLNAADDAVIDAVLARLAATRTPEPPDSGDADCRHQNENGLLCLRRRHDDLRHEFQRRIGDRSGSPAPEGGE